MENISVNRMLDFITSDNDVIITVVRDDDTIIQLFYYCENVLRDSHFHKMDTDSFFVDDLMNAPVCEIEPNDKNTLVLKVWAVMLPDWYPEIW